MTRPKRAKPKFEGVLTEPIDDPFGGSQLIWVGLGHGKPEVMQKIQDEYRSYIATQQYERLVKLAEHYGLSLDLGAADSVLALLLCVMKDFIRGFRSVKSGRPKDRDKAGGLRLMLDVDHLVAETGLTVAGACARLTSRSGRWPGKNPKSLETRYYESRKKKDDNMMAHPLYARLKQLGDAEVPDDEKILGRDHYKN